MKSVQIKISNPMYQHAQFCQKLTHVAGGFTCDINLIIGTNVGNAKSLINVMSVLGSVKFPAKLEIRASGWDDEARAVDAIAKLFDK